MNKMEQELSDQMQAIAYILDIEAPDVDASNEEKFLFVGKNIEKAQKIGLAKVQFARQILAGVFEDANAWKNAVTIANYLRGAYEKAWHRYQNAIGFLKELK